MRIYDLEYLIRALRESLSPWGGMKTLLGDEETILLKLNLLGSTSPEAAVTIHPVFVQAVLTLIQEHGAKPCIGDSPGGLQTGHPTSVSSKLRGSPRSPERPDAP